MWHSSVSSVHRRKMALCGKAALKRAEFESELTKQMFIWDHFTCGDCFLATDLVFFD